MVEVVEDSGQYFSDDDLNAVARYLKSLPARQSSGAYMPDTQKLQETAVSLKAGEIERPGAGLYMSFCAKCHQADGRGESHKFPALAGNPAVLASDTSSLIRLVLEGGTSPQTENGPIHREMPAFRNQFTDREIARALSFVRTAWGNEARPVATRDVSTVRSKIQK
jgi:mono/diheme cytochrome c family protein